MNESRIESSSEMQLLKKGLRLALLYSAAVALFLGALSLATTLALAGKSSSPTNTTEAKGAPSPKAQAVPNGDKRDPGKPEI